MLARTTDLGSPREGGSGWPGQARLWVRRRLTRYAESLVVKRQRAATERQARVGWRSEWQRVVKGWLATEGKARFARTGLRERCKVGRGWRIAAGGSRSCRRGSAQHSKTHNNQTGEGGADESRTAAIDDGELLAGRGWLWIGSRGRCSEEAFGIERRRGATPENVAILSWMATPAASLAAGQCSRVALHPPFRHLSDRCDGALKLLTCPPPLPLKVGPGCLGAWLRAPSWGYSPAMPSAPRYIILGFLPVCVCALTLTTPRSPA